MAVLAEYWSSAVRSWVVTAALGVLVAGLAGCHPFESVDGNPFGDDDVIDDAGDDIMADQMVDGVDPDTTDIADGDLIGLRSVEIVPPSGVVTPGATVALTAETIGFNDPQYSWGVTGPATLIADGGASAELEVNVLDATEPIVVNVVATDALGDMSATATFQPGTIIYVDGAVEEEEDNEGLSPDSPLETLSAALVLADTIRSQAGTQVPVEIRVANGVPQAHEDALSLPSNVIIDGGYSPDFAASETRAQLIGALTIFQQEAVEVRNLVVKGSGESQIPLLSVNDSSSGDNSSAAVILSAVALEQQANTASSVMAVENSTIALSGRLEVLMTDNGNDVVGVRASNSQIGRRTDPNNGSSSSGSILVGLNEPKNGREWVGIYLETSILKLDQTRVLMQHSMESQEVMTGVEAVAESTFESRAVIEMTGGGLSALTGVSCVSSRCVLNSPELQLSGGDQVIGVVSDAGELAVVNGEFFNGIDEGPGGCMANVCNAIVVEGQMSDGTLSPPVPVNDAGFSCCTLESFGIVLRGNRIGEVSVDDQATVIDIQAGASPACLDGNIIARPSCRGEGENTCTTAAVRASGSYLHNNAFHGASGNGPRTLVTVGGVLANNYIEVGSAAEGRAIGLRIEEGNGSGSMDVVNNVFEVGEGNADAVPIVGLPGDIDRLESNVFDRSGTILSTCDSCQILGLLGLVNALLEVVVENNGTGDCLDTDGAFALTEGTDFSNACLNLGAPASSPGAAAFDCCTLPVTSLGEARRTENTSTYMMCSPTTVPVDVRPDGMDIGPLAEVGP